ncbi:MAG: glycosyltransferase involved in cell wall biosynthesis [Flavobacteriaceae bacterium]|jgi:glycosyltransferase involved in cell wall biosynthesis|uniref:glycosyltransferase family 2 protein n=1 Tax=Candidatus Marifrigoribacter sp. Uisw_064 TaxID=3230970 RepID=UPI003AE8E0F5
MISILIPTYNYSIVNLVNTLHQQVSKAAIPFEIIVVDDCSNELNILEQNKNINSLENCQLIENPQNLGRTASRNLLSNKAIYNWLLFMDADVLPKYNDFISRFSLLENQDCQVIYGGVCYEEKRPELDKILRWVYGIKRETKSVKNRIKQPYFIISQNLLIKKDIFTASNTSNLNAYGLDILFSNNLLKNNVIVKHIDNPVYHFGLENSLTFLDKSLKAVKTTYLLEENNQIDKNLRPLQKVFHILKKWKLIGFLRFLTDLFKNPIKSNLLSKNPSMFLFDLYRLRYYIKLKNNKSV